MRLPRFPAPSSSAAAVAALLSFGCLSASEAAAQPLRPSAPPVIPGQPYVSAETTDSLGRGIQLYLSEPETERPLPLVVYVQGSGASSLFARREGGRVAGTMGHSTLRDVFSGVARVLLVEKPGVSYLDMPRSVEEASPLFHQEHTLERWTEALRAGVHAACAREDIDCAGGVLVVGHSEGGVAAARLAATTAPITHAAVLAGEGPPQLYSLLVLARAGEFFTRHGETAARREAYLFGEWNAVLTDPERADRFFFGHPYRRWSSFLSSSPAEELARADVRVFIAQGTRDRAVAPESADVLFATLAARGRDVCYIRVVGADHSFSGVPGDGWSAVLQQVQDWFTGGGSHTEKWLCVGH